jgi:ATP-binding cassette subfamily B protein
MGSIDYKHLSYLLKPYFIERRYFILLGLSSLIVVDFLQLIIPRILKRVVDDLTLRNISMSSLLWYAVYIVGLALLIGVLRYVWRRCLMGASRRVEEGLRNRLFEHLQSLSAPYFDQTKSGDLMAHATNDIQQIRMATGMGMVALNDAIVLGAAAIGFMAYINVRLTVFVLLPAPLIVFGTRFFSKKMHHRYQSVQASFADLTEAVRERIAGMRVIKAYGRETVETRQLEHISKQYVEQNIRLIRITGSFFPLMVLFTNVSLGIVLYLGGRQTITATITPGDFVAFISYLGLLTWPMMAMGWVINLIQRGVASLGRIDTILNVAPSIADQPGALPLHPLSGEIRFKGVSFSYADSSLPALSAIDLHTKTGQTVGIMGPPGSGKSTLLSLIPRFYEVKAGSIQVDGHDIRDVKLRDLRFGIGYVSQEPFLFADTIGENIRLAKANASDAELEAAIHLAALDQTIASFQNGMQTVVGEKGIILSGGQKQRIALARAFLTDAPVLLLDDPISQVDMETGQRIIQNMQSLMGRRTIIIASHRIAAIQRADHIIVLESGAIVEQGTHAELIAANGYYARTYHLQAIEEGLNAN